MKWCCEGFKTFFSFAGERGFTVFAKRSDLMVLQCRAVNKGEERLFAEAIKKAPVPISIVQELPIRYCPWCGREISRYYKNSIESITRNDMGIS